MGKNFSLVPFLLSPKSYFPGLQCSSHCSEIELKDCFNKVVICYKYDESVQGFIYFINFQVAEVQ
jgi:hypothetical protein